MKKYLLIFLFLFIGGCGMTGEPQGTPSELTEIDIIKVKWSDESLRPWVAWQMKGVRLAGANMLNEALYCFHQAQKSWPKQAPNSKIKHLPEPTDTYLQKGLLYLKLKNPELALLYFNKFEKYFPGNSIAVKGKKEAEEMLEKG